MKEIEKIKVTLISIKDKRDLNYIINDQRTNHNFIKPD
jgi:hypothetical protein